MSENHNSNIVCVSVEGYILEKDFVCKEFCLLDRDSNFLYHTTVKSENEVDIYSEKDQVRISYEEKTFGLEFDSGDTEINELIEFVYPLIKTKKVIVEHLFTVNWLKELFHTYGDINCKDVGKWFEDEPYTFDSPNVDCHYHDMDLIPRCALQNVISLNKSLSVVLPHLKDPDNTLCIGIAGFNLQDHGFKCKEFCVSSLDSTYLYHTTVKIPKMDKHAYEFYTSSILFQTTHGNGLEFAGGEITLDELISRMTPVFKGKKLLVKDYEHLFWLQKTFKNDVDVHFVDVRRPYCTRSIEFPVCVYHKNLNISRCRKYCALWHSTMLTRNFLHLYEQTK